MKVLHRIFYIALMGMCVGMSSSAWSYDAEMAKGYATLFSSVIGTQSSNALHLMQPEAFVKNIKEGKKFVTIDVRTPAETRMFAIVLPNSLAIPVNKLFLAENLDLIPKDKIVVMICKSGVRSTAVGTALRHLGFDNVYILQGGFQALSSYLGPKQAY